MGKRAIGTTVSYLSVDQKGRATLPEDVRAALGLRAGDFVLLERTRRGTYELVPAVLVPKDQLRLSHPTLQRRLRKAEADTAADRTTIRRTPAKARALLRTFKARKRKDSRVGHHARRPRMGR